ncbi:MAG: MFS transporter [Reichenbachiella sp.]
MKQYQTLIFIIVAQFFCTSIWFATNGVIDNLILQYHLPQDASGTLTSAIQLGFIFGTLTYAFFSFTDRYSPSHVFFISALLAALFNVSAVFSIHTLYSLASTRFLVGFFLAGIYPVGLKIAADHFDKGLGTAFGYLVGALVLGTALPHLLKDSIGTGQWQFIFYSTSLLSATGGILIQAFVPNGPNRTRSLKIDFSKTYTIFRNKEFRLSALAYFGHMWELYTFWALVPFIIISSSLNQSHFTISSLSFWFIAVGALGCILAGYLSKGIGTQKSGLIFLIISMVCCLASPFILDLQNNLVIILFLLLWGLSVVADSPMFSTMVAHHAPASDKGVALTIVNCIGFSITILSIQLIDYLSISYDMQWVLPTLAIGPIIGVISLLWKR